MNKIDIVKRAKIFWSGRSQAVRLPKEFRFDGAEVTIRRQGNAIILEAPKADDTPGTDEWAWLDQLEPLDADVIAATEEDEGPFEDRPERDQLRRALATLLRLNIRKMFAVQRCSCRARKMRWSKTSSSVCTLLLRHSSTKMLRCIAIRFLRCVQYAKSNMSATWAGATQT